MTQPLHGTRVLDLTRLMPGNYCAWTLSTLGADVIKVEDPGRGDYMRDFGTQVNGQGALHQLVNRGKRSVVIDLKDPQGQEVFLALVDTADILVESFRPGVLERLGLGFETLRERRPSLVYASITGYGSQGPLAHRVGHDLNYVAFSGFLDQNGNAGEAPAVPPTYVADLIGGGLNTTIAVLAMLAHAKVSGVGGRVDTALVEGATLIPSNLVGGILGGNPQPERGTAEYAGGYSAYKIYPLADGHVVVGAIEPQFWSRVAEILGEPDLVTRRSDEEFVRDTLTKHFATMTKAEARARFGDDDTCVDVLNTYEEAFSSPQAQAMGYLRRIPGLDMPVLAPPYFLDGERPAETSIAPTQGQHTDEVLAELDVDVDVDVLKRQGILAPRSASGH